MKKFLVLMRPYGELESRCDLEQFGVYETREQALENAMEYIQNDLNEYDCMINLKDFTKFINGELNKVKVSLDKHVDSNDYYEILIINLDNLQYKGE